MSDNVIPYPIPYPTLPYPTLPYPTLPYPTLPYPTLPYPTLPSQARTRQLKVVTVLCSYRGMDWYYTPDFPYLLLGTASHQTSAPAACSFSNVHENQFHKICYKTSIQSKSTRLRQLQIKMTKKKGRGTK